MVKYVRGAHKDVPDNIIDVKFGTKPSHYKCGTGSGIHYENRVVKRIKSLEQWKDWEHIHNPWISYTKKLKSGKLSFKSCEPDILIVNETEKIVIIIEAKEFNWALGSGELISLYTPLVSKLYEGYEVLGMVVSQKPFMKIQNPLGKVTLDDIRAKHPQPVIANTR